MCVCVCVCVCIHSCITAFTLAIMINLRTCFPHSSHGSCGNQSIQLYPHKWCSRAFSNFSFNHSPQASVTYSKFYSKASKHCMGMNVMYTCHWIIITFPKGFPSWWTHGHLTSLRVDSECRLFNLTHRAARHILLMGTLWDPLVISWN